MLQPGGTVMPAGTAPCPSCGPASGIMCLGTDWTLPLVLSSSILAWGDGQHMDVFLRLYVWVCVYCAFECSLFS